MSRGLLDTSVFIAFESGRPITAEQLPEESVVSPITIAELRAGVFMAASQETRAIRLATLDRISDVEVVPIDDEVANAWAILRTHLAEKNRRLNVNDLWIAATGLAKHIPVYTQDGDFGSVADVSGLEVIEV